MFKKFTREDGISNLSQVKTSVIRSVRASVCESYPYLQETGLIDVVMPKKDTVLIAKTVNKEQIIVMNGTPLFYSERDGPWYPTLRLLHQYPSMMKRLQTDEGAIKFVLSGANIMCPGLTSPGAHIAEELEAGTPVAIYGEGKEVAMAIGLTTMSTQEMKEVNRGIGVELKHHLNDGLWKTKEIA